MSKRWTAVLLAAAVCAALLAGCGKGKDQAEAVETIPVSTVEETVTVTESAGTGPVETAAPEDVPPEEGMVRSPLTNEWIDGDLADQRPIAVMIPDENAALPHYGISAADVLYECNVEGNMTRLMAVIKDWKGLERIGNVRSCRDYYVYWAKEWDAVYCHIGGPFYILNIINDPTTDNITGAVLAGNSSEKKGLVDSAYFRDSSRKAPHNAYTSGELIESAMDKLGYSETYTSNYEPNHFTFAPESAPNTLDQYGDEAFPAKKVDLSGSYTITKTYFEYNDEDGLYYRFQGMQKGDEAHIDGANDQQLCFKNLIVQFAHYESRDANGYLGYGVHDDTKDGYFFTNGKGIHVNWKKSSDYGATRFYDDAGNEIQFNTGKTMICILKDGTTIEAGE